MSYADYYIDEVRNGVRDATSKIDRVASKQDQSLANEKAMLDAFNKISKQLETLTAEIKGLRSDMNPQLDKAVKLAPPANQ